MGVVTLTVYVTQMLQFTWSKSLESWYFVKKLERKVTYSGIFQKFSGIDDSTL